MTRIAVLFERVGPYHAARLNAAAGLADLVAIETVARDSTYAWDVIGAAASPRVTLFPDAAAAGRSPAVLKAAVFRALDGAAPEVVAVPGWHDPAALAALLWCLTRGVPAVLMAESQESDAPRHVLRERLKRRVVRLFAAALIGGGPQRAYVERLAGAARLACFDGFDVVDNRHFEAGAEEARADPDASARLGLPPRYFLASARFVPEKNIPVLLDAFATYRALAPEPWSLVLLGDGPGREDVERAVAGRHLGHAVVLPGFRQYHELPACYGLAGAFVHAARREPWGLVVNEAMAAGLPVVVSGACGCAPDLVRHGVNGYAFAPDDPAALAALMRHVASPDCDRGAMAEAGRALIAGWGPERFAAGLLAAAGAALGRPAPAASRADRLLLDLLIRWGGRRGRGGDGGPPAVKPTRGPLPCV